jgi:hypothetical protein
MSSTGTVHTPSGPTGSNLADPRNYFCRDFIASFSEEGITRLPHVPDAGMPAA